MKSGQIVITRGIAEAIQDKEFAKFVSDSLMRYAKRDWGDLCDEDKMMNDSAIANNDRIVAKYGDIYIITEWDRSVTTVLLSHEY